MTTFSMMEPLSVFEQPFFPITKTSVLAASFYFATQEEHYKVKQNYRTQNYRIHFEGNDE